MVELLVEYIKKHVPSPKQGEIEEILSIFKEKEFKKGEFFKKPFILGNELAFLSKGAVRIILYKENGEEITATIREDNLFIVDPFRLEKRESSPMGIECLENLSLLFSSLVDVEKLLESNLAFNIVIRKYLLDEILNLGKKQYSFLTGSGKERYQFFVKQYPSIFKKFPLRYIASMIGISPTQLSRIRNKK